MAFTEFPWVDIRTHRSIAKWSQRFATLAFVAGIAGGYYVDSWHVAAGGLVLGLLLDYSSTSFRAQANQWALEELEKERGVHD